MNINTTINLDDLLNSNEENSSEEVVEILKESITETAKSIEENAPLPDFDAIVTEWSYRCDKGYPDMKSKSDMIKLQEILNEMGVASPFKRIEELTAQQRAAKAAKAKAAKSPATVKKKVSKKPSTAGNLAKFMALVNGEAEGQTNNPDIPDGVKQRLFDVFKKYPDKQATWIKQFQQMEDEVEFVGNEGAPWQEFFGCIASSGMGRGEMQAVMAIRGAKSGGTKEKDFGDSTENPK